jgi:hypothetical protein
MSAPLGRAPSSRGRLPASWPLNRARPAVVVVVAAAGKPPSSRPSSVRAPKDPRAFSSYDAIRAHLHGSGKRQDGGGGFIAGLLNGLSDGAFGSHGRGPASFYRFLLRLGSGSGRASLAGRRDQDDDDSLTNAPPPAQSEALAALLMISPTRAAAMARRHSAVLSRLPPSELGRRVLALKQALPGCDVAALVEARPDLYLGDGETEEAAVVTRAEAEDEEAQQQQQQPQRRCDAAAQRAAESLAALREALPGADVHEIAFEDPALLFHPPRKLRRGLRRLQALWPEADEATFAASEPRHLALAVRALGEGEGDDDGAEEEDDDDDERERRMRR